MPTVTVTPPLCLIFLPLLYDAMPTDRVTPPICRIVLLLLSGVMPTDRVSSWFQLKDKMWGEHPARQQAGSLFHYLTIIKPTYLTPSLCR